MGLMNEIPLRPRGWEFESIAELYRLFQGLFLNAEGYLESKCGHRISVFDHHFFHMCGVTRDKARLFMPEEKEQILALATGFGEYELAHGGSRARDLPSAHATLLDPDEVWTENPTTNSAEWIYVKEFDSKPYPFTVALLMRRPDENGIIVPVSSFAARGTE